jgi:hypothetical protein
MACRSSAFMAALVWSWIPWAWYNKTAPVCKLDSAQGGQIVNQGEASGPIVRLARGVCRRLHLAQHGAKSRVA